MRSSKRVSINILKLYLIILTLTESQFHFPNMFTAIVLLVNTTIIGDMIDPWYYSYKRCLPTCVRSTKSGCGFCFRVTLALKLRLKRSQIIESCKVISLLLLTDIFIAFNIDIYVWSCGCCFENLKKMVYECSFITTILKIMWEKSKNC